MLAAIVKSVPSGDTVVVMGVDASRGPPPEKLLSLSGVAAPRLGNKSTPDQPYAWQAREFLRRNCVGKRVTFQLEAQATPAANRAFGDVFLEDGSSLSLLMVSSGWAKVRPGGPPELVEAASAAEVRGLGLWGAGPSAATVREVQYAGSFDSSALFPSLKAAPPEAIIEQVVNGSTLRVLLLPTFHQITLMLSGIQCGGIRRLEDGTEDAQPFASRGALLCRDTPA